MELYKPDIESQIRAQVGPAFLERVFLFHDGNTARSSAYHGLSKQNDLANVVRYDQTPLFSNLAKPGKRPSLYGYGANDLFYDCIDVEGRKEYGLNS